MIRKKAEIPSVSDVQQATQQQLANLFNSNVSAPTPLYQPLAKNAKANVPCGPLTESLKGPLRAPTPDGMVGDNDNDNEETKQEELEGQDNDNDNEETKQEELE